jgi:peptidoglycan/LPS O-acetylase OafA/YrhL
MTAKTEFASSMTTGSGHFRPDIEGMRAIAVLLILLFHAGIPLFPGGYVGVDVFFVISGFLITGLLIRELEASGTIRRARFYARRIRRLLPAAALLLVAVTALTIVALPTLRWAGIATDIRWSALYAVNWRFAEQAVDYLAAEEAAGPLQHFWSLAVEEQFYLLWPLLLLGAGRFAGRLRLRLRPTLLIALAIIGIPSLLWSIYLTGAEPDRAFFVSTTRMWELALGGGIAILAPAISQLSRRVGAVFAAAGLAGIGVVGMGYDSLTPFPGWLATVPVVATALLISAGIIAPTSATARILGSQPMQAIGARSYSLYLWHWPLLVVAVANWGPLSAWEGTGVVALSALPAIASYRFVEGPLRRSSTFISPPRRGLAYGFALTAVGLAAAAVLTIAVPDRPGTAIEQSSPTTTATQTPTSTTAPAPASTTSTTAAPPSTTATPSTTTPEETEPPTIGPIQPDTVLQVSAGPLTPDPLDARSDLPAVYGDGCHQNQSESNVLSCTYGDPTSEIEVVIVGDSHAAMWVPSLRPIADEQRWRLRTITKSNCQLADILIANGEQQRPYENCADWNEAVIAELIATGPDLVLVAGRFWPTLIGEEGLIDGPARATALADSLASSWLRLTDGRLNVVAFQDVPYPEFDVAECVSENRTDLVRCAIDRNDSMKENTPHAAAAARIDIGVIDLTSQVCFAELCPSVVDDILLWRDTHHLTATYARLLAPALAAQLAELAPQLFSGDPTS